MRSSWSRADRRARRHRTVRRYTSRSGVSLNLEQQISPDLGMFARAGIASGGVEPYEFSDIDRTLAAGLSLSGKQWGRPDDTIGIAGVVNGISGAHKGYFNAGGLGILAGDGQLAQSRAGKDCRNLLQLPDRKLASDARLSVHCQSGLQP